MEKTMEYALSEALEMGRRSAMPNFLEQELREKIAQEIEKTCRCKTPYTLEKDGVITHHVHKCSCSVPFYADLVRGLLNDSN
jgi:hypothetical protein